MMTSVLFSGHMIDAPGRAEPRFPADRVPHVRRAVRRAVGGVDDPDAVAVSGAACGGDLIFAEAWLATDRPLTVFLPRLIESFLDESVRFAGPEWEAAFTAVVAHPGTTVVDPGPAMDTLVDPHTPNNLRMLKRASTVEPPLIGIFVWDGGGDDGPGGTRHMVSTVHDLGGRATIIHP